MAMWLRYSGGKRLRLEITEDEILEELGRDVLQIMAPTPPFQRRERRDP